MLLLQPCSKSSHGLWLRYVKLVILQLAPTGACTGPNAAAGGSSKTATAAAVEGCLVVRQDEALLPQHNVTTYVPCAWLWPHQHQALIQAWSWAKMQVLSGRYAQLLTHTCVATRGVMPGPHHHHTPATHPLPTSPQPPISTLTHICPPLPPVVARVKPELVALAAHKLIKSRVKSWETFPESSRKSWETFAGQKLKAADHQHCSPVMLPLLGAVGMNWLCTHWAIPEASSVPLDPGPL